MLSFGDALKALSDGRKITRKSWNGENQWVALQRPDEHSKMKRTYFYLHPVDGQLVPWVPTVSDCLADDWEVLI